MPQPGAAARPQPHRGGSSSGIVAASSASGLQSIPEDLSACPGGTEPGLVREAPEGGSPPFSVEPPKQRASEGLPAFTLWRRLTVGSQRGSSQASREQTLSSAVHSLPWQSRSHVDSLRSSGAGQGSRQSGISSQSLPETKPKSIWIHALDRGGRDYTRENAEAEEKSRYTCQQPPSFLLHSPRDPAATGCHFSIFILKLARSVFLLGRFRFTLKNIFWIRWGRSATGNLLHPFWLTFDNEELEHQWKLKVSSERTGNSSASEITLIPPAKVGARGDRPCSLNKRKKSQFRAAS